MKRPKVIASRGVINDLAKFAREHVASWDIDPVYPVLAWLEADQREWGETEAALQRSLVYVAFYNIASSETYLDVVGEAPAGEAPDVFLRLPTGVERRALRGGHPMLRHLQSLEQEAGEHGSLEGWLKSEGFAWSRVRRAVETAWGNGRWASYKTAEVLLRVHAWPLVAPDMGNYGSSGPRQTLERLYDLPPGNSTEAVIAADVAAADLRDRLESAGVPLAIEQLETVLCDFGSMLNGHFYVGHDIDHMLEQTMHASVPDRVRLMIWEARRAALPNEYLGELQGWRGVSKPLLRHYLETGEVVTRPEWSTSL